MHTARIASLASLLAPTLLCAGCGTSPADAGAPDLAMAALQDLARPPGPDGPESAGDLAVPPAATYAAVTTADFAGKTGTLATIRLSDLKVTKMIDTKLGSNNSVQTQNGKVIVFDGDHGTIRVYDPAANFLNPVEVKAGDDVVKAATANPHDIAFLPASSRAYVALYGNDAAHAIGIVDFAPPAVDGGASGPRLTGYIALPLAAKDTMDGKPEANNLWVCGQFVYVTLQDLDESVTFAPTGPGRIVAIDTSTDKVDATNGVIQLAGANPNGLARDGAACDLVLVAEPSNQFGGKLDGTGGIERVDLTLRQSKGAVIKDSDLGGHPNTVSTTPSRALAYAILTSAAGDSTQVVAFDPMAGKSIGPISPSAGYLAFAGVSPDGTRLLIGVNSPDKKTMKPAAGVYAVAPDGKSMLGMTPLDVGQAPISMAFF